MKHMPTRSRQAATSSGVRSTPHPSASSTSAEPQRELVRGCRAWPPCTPGPATTKAAVVEMLNVPSPSPPVPHDIDQRGPVGVRPARPCGAWPPRPAISSAVSPLTREPSASRRSAPRRQAVHDPFQGGSRFRPAEITPFGQSLQRVGETSGHDRRPALLAQGRSSQRPPVAEEVPEQVLAHRGQQALGMELHALDGGLCAQAHDLALLGPRRDLEHPAASGRRAASGIGWPRTAEGGLRRRPCHVMDGRRPAVHEPLARTTLPPYACPIDWWPRQTPSTGTPRTLSTAEATPASFGVHGPGETSTCVGLRDAIAVMSSLLTTCTAAPSSPRYCTRLNVKES